MKLLLKSLALFVAVAFATPVLAFSYSCADWKNRDLAADLWKEATRATIADCIQDMGFVMGFSVKDRDDFGATPLHFAAALATNPDVIIALVEAGADVHARNEIGTMPMHWAAARNSNPDVITALLEAGADINARDEDGTTPLHEAARLNRNPDVITALLEAGADGSIENNDGKTPFHYARGNEAIKNTDAYWALNDARFNKGVQTALVAPQESSSVPIFGPPMTGGEKDAFRLAVNACWIVEPGAEWARVIVTVGFSLGQDGRVIGDVQMINASGGNDAQTATAFQAARRAILRCQRSGYKLPPEKYQSWQNMEMTFDASDMRLR